LDFANVELRVRRAMDQFAASASQENEYDLLLAVANVEQWLFAHRDSKAIGVVEGAPYWWRGKRDVKLFNRQTILGRAQRIGGNRYTLTVPAYTVKGRFVSIEFSPDGTHWSEPQPYQVQHEYAAPEGSTRVFVRLSLKSASGVTRQRPVEIAL